MSKDPPWPVVLDPRLRTERPVPRPAATFLGQISLTVVVIGCVVLWYIGLVTVASWVAGWL